MQEKYFRTVLWDRVISLFTAAPARAFILVHLRRHGLKSIGIEAAGGMRGLRYLSP